MMMQQQQRSVADALQDSELVPEGGVLTTFVVVACYLDGDGAEEVVRMTSDDIADWQYDGLLHNALYNWPEDDDDAL